MSITIRQVLSKSALREFIFLPGKIHRGDSRWLPPIYFDEWKFYNPKHNKSISLCENILFLAYKNSVPVGRVMGIINSAYNSLRNEKTARFFNMECENDQEVAHALLLAVESWAIERFMDKMIGPYGFSDKDPQGIQIEGFEEVPVIATASNFPYLKELIEEEGYCKKFDCFVYKLEVPEEIPVHYLKVYDRLMQSRDLVVIEFKSRRELKPYILPVLRLVNETYNSIYGFVPMDEDEMKQLATKYLPILDPEFTKLITDTSGEPLAFIVASPDMSKGIQKARGRLFPFGFLHILSSIKKSRQLDLFLGAVKDQDKNRGLTALLGVKIFQSAINRKMSFIDSHLILESNKAMRAVMERLGANIYKKYRVYEKDLPGIK